MTGSQSRTLRRAPGAFGPQDWLRDLRHRRVQLQLSLANGGELHYTQRPQSIVRWSGLQHRIGSSNQHAQGAMANRVNRNAVETWIADFGLESEPHPQHDAEFEWSLLVSGQAFKTIVAQRRSDFNYLAMQATVAVSPEHQAVIRKLNDESSATFLFDLRLALHNQSVGHSIELEGAGVANQPDLPIRVTVGTNLTMDRIGRADIFKANHAIQTGASIVALMFQRLAHRKRWP